MEIDPLLESKDPGLSPGYTLTSMILGSHVCYVGPLCASSQQRRKGMVVTTCVCFRLQVVLDIVPTSAPGSTFNS